MPGFKLGPMVSDFSPPVPAGSKETEAQLQHGFAVFGNQGASSTVGLNHVVLMVNQ